MYSCAEECWSALDANKQSFLTRAERYAALTIVKVLLPQGYDVLSLDQSHDFQSLGAQGVNNVVNKLMIAMFSPARPFFKVKVGKKIKAQMLQGGLTEQDFVAGMAQMERDACAEIDTREQRPKLYQGLRHLVVVGNVLMHFGNDGRIRVMGIRHFCVKRNANGDLHTFIIREEVKFDELEPSVQAMLNGRYQADSKVCHYRMFTNMGNGYIGMSQWVNGDRLPSQQYDGKWKYDDCPYKILTWDLSDEADYGTGLVEEYIAGLETLSSVTEATTSGSVVGTEVRYTIRPTSQLTADEAQKSENGDFIPGNKDDIATVQAENYQAVKVSLEVQMHWERTIGIAFLMNSAITRNAERVTAEEIRMQAQELESAYGGVYSALAPQIQRPVASWGLKMAGTDIKGTDLKVVVITGLEAMSRNGELDNLRQALNDLALVTQAPPLLQERLKWTPLVNFVGAGRGVPLGDFVMNDEEFAQVAQQRAASRVQEQGATAGAQAAGQNMADQQQPMPATQ